MRAGQDTRFDQWIENVCRFIMKMKTIIKNIIGLAVLLAGITVQAFDWNNVIGFAQAVETNRSVTLTVYPSYAPDLKLSDGEDAKWGFGAAAMYPIGTPHILGGLRVDYLAGTFWAPSLTVTPNASVQLFGHDFTAFGTGGTIVPLSGMGNDNEKVGAIIGGGLYTQIWKPSKNTELYVYGAYERWTPVLNVNVYHASLAFTVHF